jgi:hypothetical protein
MTTQAYSASPLDIPVSYWLCCGSKDKFHSDERAKKCIEAKIGRPEHCRFGKADDHSAWAKTIANA